MRIVHVLPMMFLAAAACGDEPTDEDPDVEGCEHLENGPYVAVTASNAPDASAPAVAADHQAYTITLPAGVIGNGGYVSFPVGEAGDYLFFLDQTVTAAFTTSAGAAIAPEESATSSPACATIRGRHLVPLEVGTAFLQLSSETVATVNLVIEPAAHEE